jgi:DegV family protein with EDD domain
MTVRIINDSAASLPEYLRLDNSNGRIEVPLTVVTTVNGKDKEWIDRPFESENQRLSFTNDIRKASSIKTSQPSPGEYIKAYEQIIESEPNRSKSNKAEIAVITMSGALSGSMRSAQLAAVDFEKYSDVNIVVANSNTVSIGEGLITAQTEAENTSGAFDNANQLVDRVEELSKDLYVVQALSDLNFLYRGGRIGAVKGLLASALGIKPLINIDTEGNLKSIDNIRARHWDEVREKMVKYVADEAGQIAVRLAVLYFATDQDNIDNLYDSIHTQGKFNIAKDINGKEYETMMCEQSLSMCAHSGPNILGIGALALRRSIVKI